MLRRIFLTVPISAFGANWPMWRGPNENGVAEGPAPLEWSDSNGVKWKVEIPGRGFSTPVIWGNRLYLTTAIPQGGGTEPAEAGGGRGPGGGAGLSGPYKFVVMAVDRATGKTVWEKVAKVATPHEGYHRAYGSFASNSAVTDGKYVIAPFGSRGVYCYDMDGKLVWSKDHDVQMRMRNQFGEGAPPTLEGNILLLKYDQEKGSFLVALDKSTGKELWRHDRPGEVSSWSGALVIEHGGKKQAIVSGTGKTRGYELETGKVIWECAGLGTNVIPMPVYEDGIVVVMSGHREPNLQAIRLGKTGDLTGSDSILWTNQRGNAYTAAPVLHQGKLYFVTDSGMVSCFDVKTGKPFYQQQRLPKPYNFKASPVAAAGRLYLATEDEDVVVLRLGEKYEVLATNTLAGQSFIASPVVADGEMYLRSRTHLFCIQ